MDFDRSLKPPPQPTEEFTSSLEDLIKRRIADQQFDDPIRGEPPTDLVQKQAAELDDKQSAKVSHDCFLLPLNAWLPGYYMMPLVHEHSC